MAGQPVFRDLPKTEMGFTNVPLVPVRTRSGERRFLSATVHGAMHLFDERGREKVIPYPESDRISYAFVADAEDGFAWAVHTGGVITRIDVDAGAYDFVERVPLAGLNWGACITRDGLIACEASPCNLMVYDTRARRVLHTFVPFSSVNHYGHFPRALADGRVVVPMSTPGKEFILLDPRSGRRESFTPPGIADLAWFPKSITVLPDGRLGLPRETRVQRFDLPRFEEAPALDYPAAHDGPWSTFRDYGDGRLFAWPASGGPLYALGPRNEWEVIVDRFDPRLGRAECIMFTALDGRRILGLDKYGEVVLWERDGAARLITHLDNYGQGRISALAPGEGSRVFTTSFINTSMQALDWRTGVGRNIRPCQEHGGQASCAIAFEGKAWLGCYGGAEINCYDPARGGEWPENPRPIAKLGHGQMRPTALVSDGRFLWCATHAEYGKLGGAVSRIDPRTGECRVWLGLAGEHNFASLAADPERGLVYAGSDIHADCDSAPAAPGSAVIVAIDARRETAAWTARPRDKADVISFVGVYDGLVLARAGAAFAQFDPADGRTVATYPVQLPEHWTKHAFFIGPDGALYVASEPDGLFRYDLAAGLRERLVEGPVALPRVRGRDFFFIRDSRLGVVEGLW